MISTTVNGEKRDLPPGTTLIQLVSLLQLKPERLAIEYNRRIVKPGDWNLTITDGAEIEIVHFVGGG